MLKKYYYLFVIPIICLLFFSVANAGTETTVQITAPVSNGSALTIQTKSYGGLQATNLGTDGTDTYAEFSPILNVLLNGANQKYLNGKFWIDFDLNFTSSSTVGSSFTGAEYVRGTQGEGIHTYISAVSHSWFRLYVIFDNYYSVDPNIDLGYIKLNYQCRYGDVSPLTANLSVNMTVYSNTVAKTDFTNNRTTEELYTAIYQATAPELNDILSMLSAIKSQDLTYYVSLINQLSQLHTDNQQLHTDLIGILNELDLDFQSVQTVLDLFPSYRTAVLQYWQDLLQMNATQSSAAAEIESQYADKEAQSATLVAGLGSLNMPSISAGDLDILSRVDTGQKANFFGLLSIITNNSYITTLLLIICTGAIVGFILYGKKQ